MVLLKKTEEFIKRNGSEIDNAKLNVILNFNSLENQQKILDYYTLLQNNDGGFPYDFKRNLMSSINTTTYALFIMNDYQLADNDVFQKGLEYLFNNQKSNGSWNEFEKLKKLNPPDWNDPTNPFTPIWLTANVCFLLAKLGFIPSAYITNGVNYLFSLKNDDSQIRGYFITNWLLTGILLLMQGSDDALVKNYIKILEKNMNKILDSSNVVWCLQTLLDSGLKRSHPIIKKMIENLLKMQQEDGKWQSTDGELFDINTTLSVLIVLKSLNLLKEF